ncbi:sodium-dependent transporter [Mesobacillus subterraneus]|uniref:Transporter n=1 Tax=Mesobacillus subterraneus TaxID=285983 RepID=A0A3R9ECZ8_9BACI|nr:sodium-dependent transporter [Mesobacillus subterraneus]RSD27557.1 sodium-dependent transporter [Mesobacillus subterraneus]
MSKHEQWSSKLGFILAAAGSAIGLGAIWKFPYMAGTNGGGIFLVFFLLMTIFIGGPILLAEFIIGRNSQKDAVQSYKHLAPKSAWPLLGYGGVIASFLILSFYSVVGGWILSYLVRSLTGGLSGLSQPEYGATFEKIISNPVEAVAVQLLFLLLTILVVQGGVQQGIEKASKYMMPALFILFIILVIRSLTLNGAMAGVEFLLKPDWSAVTGQTVLLALGQSFFALSVGLSVMVTYASYLPKGESLAKSAFSVVGLNILISLLAGLVIFPAVFAFGLEPEAGPGLVFVVLPAVFEELAFGGIFLTIFLVLLLFATLTSAFSILEIIVAVLSKGNKDKRKKYAWISGLLVFAAGIPNALSFGILSDVTFFGKTFFDLADFLTSNIALPLGALFIAIFVGYALPRKMVRQELEQGSGEQPLLFRMWYFSIRYIVPVGIGFVFLQSIGIL